MEHHNEESTLAAQRSQGYWLLSQLFLQVPDRTHLLALQADLATFSAEGALGELRREVDGALEVPDVAAVEFTRRLVVVSKHSDETLPYESFAREGRVPGDATEQVMACMADAGFADVAPDAPSPDHIGAELKFMALLCYEENQAWENGDASAAAQMRERQRQFLNDHLAVWAVDYCKALAARCTQGYMQAVARLAHDCLVLDIPLLGELSA
jgi:putative dimethyl sulfoxide reductase chaperone